MKREIALSLILHIVIVVFTVATSPFDVKIKHDYGEVIRVSLAAMPEPVINEPVTLPPPEVPQAAFEESEPDIPIEDPTTLPEADVPKEPEPEKPKPSRQQTSESGQQTDAGSSQNQIDTPESGTGSPFQGATIDNATFNYPYWFTQAFQKIRSNWRNPISADGTIVCTIYFQVIKSGRVVDIKVIESSGLPAFDRACLAAVERSAPFPPLPRQFADEIIGITLPFQYQP